MNGGIYTDAGDNWLLNRAYSSSSSYDEPFYMQYGVGQTTPLKSDIVLENVIPVSDGVVNDDGSNTLTGSAGGGNSTDNTTTYKEGAGVTDNTAQNLISNTSSATKTWVISNLAAGGVVVDGTKYGGCFIYVKDQTTLDYFLSSGDCLTVKFGSDSSNYYSITKTVSDLVIGWNWINSYPNIVSDLTETGTVGSPIDYFEISIITNNVSDSWDSGDVIYDLLRSYDFSDTLKQFISGFPTFDTILKTALLKTTLAVANGYDVGELGVLSKDFILLTHDVITPESKDSNDEFKFSNTDEVN